MNQYFYLFRWSKDLHNKNRPRPGNNSYEKAIEGIKKVKNALGPDAISALMTTTLESMDNIEAIIDEYIKNDFNGIFKAFISLWVCNKNKIL